MKKFNIIQVLLMTMTLHSTIFSMGFINTIESLGKQLSQILSCSKRKKSCSTRLGKLENLPVNAFNLEISLDYIFPNAADPKTSLLAITALTNRFIAFHIGDEDSKTVKIFDLKNNNMYWHLHNVNSVYSAENNKSIALICPLDEYRFAAAEDNKIIIYDLYKKSSAHVLRHQKEVFIEAIIPLSPFILLTFSKGKFFLWNLKTDKLLKSVGIKTIYEVKPFTLADQQLYCKFFDDKNGFGGSRGDALGVINTKDIFLNKQQLLPLIACLFSSLSVRCVVPADVLEKFLDKIAPLETKGLECKKLGNFCMSLTAGTIRSFKALKVATYIQDNKYSLFVLMPSLSNNKNEITIIGFDQEVFDPIKADEFCLLPNGTLVIVNFK